MDQMSFEQAFERLEVLLELMNSGKTPLEESLKLFEEAEKLMRHCASRLNIAEQKIEQLIKTRNGELLLDADKKPKLEPFAYSTSQGSQGYQQQGARSGLSSQRETSSTHHQEEDIPF